MQNWIPKDFSEVTTDGLKDLRDRLDQTLGRIKESKVRTEQHRDAKLREMLDWREADAKRMTDPKVNRVTEWTDSTFLARLCNVVDRVATAQRQLDDLVMQESALVRTWLQLDEEITQRRTEQRNHWEPLKDALDKQTEEQAGE